MCPHKALSVRRSAFVLVLVLVLVLEKWGWAGRWSIAPSRMRPCSGWEVLEASRFFVRQFSEGEPH
jgi:hypothetical protein